jgi:hypothetical protein
VKEEHAIARLEDLEDALERHGLGLRRPNVSDPVIAHPM